MSDFLNLLLAVRTKPIRTCRTMHACCACDKVIQDGQKYHDGGYGKRAHVECLNRITEEETGALPCEPCPIQTGEAHTCDRDDGWCRDKLGRSFECERHCLGESCPEENHR